MDAQGKFIPKAKLVDWLAELSTRFHVWIPRREGQTESGAVVYRPFDPALPLEEKQPELDKKPVESAKKVIFPRSEALFKFQRDQDPAKKRPNLQVPDSPGPSLVFGLPPCDARGFLIFDPVYDGSGPQNQPQDTYYLRRRAETVLIAKSCARALSTCFCHWVGGSPSSREGADALATEIDTGLVIFPLTPQGEAALQSPLFSPADKAHLQAAKTAEKTAAATLPPAEDVSGSVRALQSLFGNAAFWQAEASPCLSCGICTYLCPTCYCFNITDEAAGSKGVRLRNWDACMTSLFTLEASGHNPRPDKAARLKNRIGHKFSYYPELHNARIACVGCGRCIKSCPSGVDIRRIVTNALLAAQTSGNKENAHD